MLLYSSPIHFLSLDPATQASLPFLESTKFTSIIGPFHVLFPLPRGLLPEQNHEDLPFLQVSLFIRCIFLKERPSLIKLYFNLLAY